MSREIRINLIAKDDVSGRLQVISAEAEKTSSSLQKAGSDGAKGMDQVSKAAERTAESLDRSAVAAGAFGGAILSALVVPIGMGTKAAWDQVDAVEQATLALRAYEKDARKVEDALADMLAFARSDAGRLFLRQELFAFAQQLRVAGVETENLARYTEIASRSVATGMGNWDELARVITRVGQTSRLTSIDFEMLQKMGFQLDQDLRNQTVTWEELFTVLEQGSVTVEGATDTIRGQVMMTTTSIRSLGLALLQVDSETSQFVEGGLGSLAYSLLPTVRDGLASMIPVAEMAGSVLAFLGGGAQLAAEGFLAMPQGLQTTVFALVGGFGALTVGASALVLAFTKIRAAAVATRATFIALGNTVRAHPILLIASIVGGVALSAWARHRSAVEETRLEYEALNTAIETVDDIIRSARLGGDVVGALRMENLVNTTRSGIAEWTDVLNEGEQAWGDFVDSIYGDPKMAQEFVQTDFFRNVVLEYQKLSEVGQDIIDEMLAGNLDVIEAHLPGLALAMSQYYLAYLPTDSDRTQIERELESLFELITNPNIDTNEAISTWNALFDEFIGSADRPNLLGFVEAWQQAEEEMIAGIGEVTESATGLTGVLKLLRDETDSWVDSVMRLNDISDDDSFLDRLLKTWGTSAADRGAVLSFLRTLETHYTALDDMPAPDAAHAEWLAWVNEAEHGTGAWQLRVDAATQALEAQGLVLDENNDAIDLNNNLVYQQVLRAYEHAEAVEAQVEAQAELNKLIAENLDHLIEVAGFGDPLSRWNIAGNATDLSTLAMNANHAAGALESIFRVVVGNTNAIGSQFDQIFKWAEDLIAEEGAWSKLDELLDAGRITGTHGVFDDGSEYALAQQAFNSIAEESVRIQESLLTIQAKQAPLIAEQASAYEDLIYEISMLPAQQQMVTLGWMDQASAAKAIELQTLAVAAANGELGKSGQQMFSQVIEGAVAADPVLKAMLLDMGLISEGADGTITVNYDDVVDGKSEIAQLTDAIYLLIEALTGVPVNVTTTVDVVDNATSPIQNIINMINGLPDRRTTVIQTVLETVERYVGPTPYAHGGMIREYATGGVLFRAAEWNRPEIAHFATGGTALLPRDGLYNAPAGTYISPNNAISNHYGAPSVYVGDIHVHGNVTTERELTHSIAEAISREMVGAAEENWSAHGGYA